jgi:hypothetical protein
LPFSFVRAISPRWSNQRAPAILIGLPLIFYAFWVDATARKTHNALDDRAKAT